MEELCSGSAALLRFNASKILADALDKHTHAERGVHKCRQMLLPANYSLRPPFESVHRSGTFGSGENLARGAKKELTVPIEPTKKEPDVPPKKPDIQPEPRPEEIPQDKDVPERESPPMQLEQAASADKDGGGT
jgi:hypothetical protein